MTKAGSTYRAVREDQQHIFISYGGHGTRGLLMLDDVSTKPNCTEQQQKKKPPTRAILVPMYKHLLCTCCTYVLVFLLLLLLLAAQCGCESRTHCCSSSSSSEPEPTLTSNNCLYVPTDVGIRKAVRAYLSTIVSTYWPSSSSLSHNRKIVSGVRRTLAPPCRVICESKP